MSVPPEGARKPGSMRRVLLSLFLVVCVGFACAWIYAIWPTHTRPIGLRAASTTDPAVIEHGRYLATAADCGACHSPRGGPPFSGSVPLASPIGTIYSVNITPDRETGIGSWSLDDFEHTLRHGFTKKGLTVYPAMPYPSYAVMSDEDITAMYAYFMHAVEPVRSRRPPNEIPWPLSMRWPLAIWRKVFAPGDNAGSFNASRYGDAKVARGAYLVQGAGHCGACHTPRAITEQEKGLNESDDAYLSGGPVIDGWVAVNLRGDVADGLGGWTKEQIVGTLRGARNATRAVIGSAMNDVVVHSTQYLNDSDLDAIASYLKTLKPTATTKSTFAADPATARDLRAGREAGRGAQLYLDNCSACHHSNGEGAPGAFPGIAGNSSVLADNPASLIRLVLGGASLPSTETAPSTLGMPAFAWRLSDSETARVVTFIRQSWGNHASGVQASQVARIRSELMATAKSSSDQ
jgi:mono/diheme cytochrome c family protein